MRCRRCRSSSWADSPPSLARWARTLEIYHLAITMVTSPRYQGPGWKQKKQIKYLWLCPGRVPGNASCPGPTRPALWAHLSLQNQTRARGWGQVLQSLVARGSQERCYRCSLGQGERACCQSSYRWQSQHLVMVQRAAGGSLPRRVAQQSSPRCKALPGRWGAGVRRDRAPPSPVEKPGPLSGLRGPTPVSQRRGQSSPSAFLHAGGCRACSFCMSAVCVCMYIYV